MRRHSRFISVRLMTERDSYENIVIAAGYATRLGELTRNFPKPLLQIGESTILGRMLDDDLLVVAADNILMFSFKEFVDFAREKDSSCIMCHHQPSIERLQRTGVVLLDENNRVLNMEEKPQVPKSTWAVPPFYIYLKKDLDLVRHSVENGCGKDAPGNLAHYMVDNTVMHAWPMSAGRFDIGSLDSYEEAKKLFG